LFVEVAVPIWSAGTEFCAASTTFCMIRRSPAPSRKNMAPTVQSEVLPASVVIHTIAAVITATPACLARRCAGLLAEVSVSGTHCVPVGLKSTATTFESVVVQSTHRPHHESGIWPGSNSRARSVVVSPTSRLSTRG